MTSYDEFTIWREALLKAQAAIVELAYKDFLVSRENIEMEAIK